MTEVVHGPDPKFEREVVAGSEYGLTTVGYYTKEDGWTAGGVTASTYSSDQPAKRRNELLGMRSIFHHWWLEQWVACDGASRKEGAEYLIGPVVRELSS